MVGGGGGGPFLFSSVILLGLWFQIDEEVAKLLALKAQLGDNGPKKFVLKTPKVSGSFIL